MDFSKLDADFFTRQSAYTKQIHRDLYPSIDPKLPTLSQKNKVVIITGSSSGIGAQGLAPAFAQAGAHVIVLVGRRKDRLEATASTIRHEHPNVTVMEAPISITDADAINVLFTEIKSRFGGADVLINNAGVLGQSGELAVSEPSVWWKDFETNLRGTYLITQKFLQLLGKSKHGTVLSLTSGAATVVLPTMSSYGISKLAVNRMAEFIAAEHPNVTSVALDPGIVQTDMMFEAMSKFAKDTPQLVGGAAVWLSTTQAEFLTGRTVAANWSVDDLLARKDEIITNDDLKIEIRGKFGLDG